MNDLSSVMTRSGLALGAAMLVLWLVSLKLRDSSIVDPFWGSGFVLIAWIAFLGGEGVPARRVTAGALVTLWGLRLSVHLFLRNRGHGEDRRYQSLRRRLGPHYWLKSLLFVFLFQGALLFVVSLPLQVAMVARRPAFFTPVDGLGAALFGVGFLFEVVADVQLTRFRADPESRGKVLDTGLWRYSRHPNYFGDAVLWWGLSCFAVATGAYWALVSPALMTLLLRRGSGVPILERTITSRRPDYAAYQARTSPFFPWPPRKGP